MFSNVNVPLVPRSPSSPPTDAIHSASVLGDPHFHLCAEAHPQGAVWAGGLNTEGGCPKVPRPRALPTQPGHPWLAPPTAASASLLTPPFARELVLKAWTPRFIPKRLRWPPRHTEAQPGPVCQDASLEQPLKRPGAGWTPGTSVLLSTTGRIPALTRGLRGGAPGAKREHAGESRGRDGMSLTAAGGTVHGSRPPTQHGNVSPRQSPALRPNLPLPW